MSQGVPSPIPDCLPKDIARTGQPTLCTPSLISEVCALLSRGGYPSVALAACGVSPSNHAVWLKWADRDLENGLTEHDSPYIAYLQGTEKAVADRELSLAALVADAAAAGPQYWAAGMTYLERRHPDRWGRREPVAPAADVRVQIIHYGGTGSTPVVPIVEVRQLPAPAPDGD